MIREYIDIWNEYKMNLQEWIATTPQETIDYEILLKKTIELVINKGICDGDWGTDFYHLDIDCMKTIDFGDYQGTLLFVIPQKHYQPSAEDTVITWVDYGSCSGCDTLESIREYESGLPDEKQIKGYMLICLHLVENMRYVEEVEE